jgi:plastocyanin
MSEQATRAERRVAALAERRAHRVRGRSAADTARARRATTQRLAFGAVVAAVLGLGGILAFGDFLGRDATPEGVISVQASMAGFTPAEIRVRAGERVTLDFWTQDGRSHLRGGVHTMIGHELGLHEELPGADPGGTSRVVVSFTAPATPGEYDIYCDTCCGGRESPSMHGRIVVEA